MKKITLLFTVLAIQFVAYSQGNMRFGMKGGLNYSTIIETTNKSDGLSRQPTTSPKISIHGGFTFEFLFTERISVQVEALYSAKGAKMINSYQTSDGTEVVKHLNYISFPILGKYYATPNLSIEFGPEIGILLNAKDVFKGMGEVNILKEISKHDFGIVGGLSYEFSNGLFIQGRYNLGLLNVSNTNKNSIAYYKHKNSVIQASVGYIF